MNGESSNPNSGSEEPELNRRTAEYMNIELQRVGGTNKILREERGNNDK